MSETFEKWWQENTDLADLPNARLAKAAWNAALASKSSVPAETEMELRRLMWLSHGHHGIYGDDGEMQCAECGRFGCWDYKNAPLDEVRATFYKAKESLMFAAPKSSAEGESNPEHSLEIVQTYGSACCNSMTSAHHPNCPTIAAPAPQIGWEQARETVRANNAYLQAYAENSPRYGWRIFSCPVSSPYKTVKLGSGSDEPSAWLSARARMMEEKCEGCGELSSELKESLDSVLLCPECSKLDDPGAPAVPQEKREHLCNPVYKDCAPCQGSGRRDGEVCDFCGGKRLWAEDLAAPKSSAEGESKPEEQERVCEKCGTWVYYDNGDCEFHCACDMGWIWKPVTAPAPKDESGKVELPALDEEYRKADKDWLQAHRGTLTGWNSLPESESIKFQLQCRERQVRAALAENKRLKELRGLDCDAEVKVIRRAQASEAELQRLREKNASLLKEIQEKNHAGARKSAQRLKGDGK